MTSTGVTADLANNGVSLPEMDGRPHQIHILMHTLSLQILFGLRGSVTIKKGPQLDVQYCSGTSRDSTAGTTTGSFCTVVGSY